MKKVENLAIIYKLELKYKYEKYIFIGNTFNFELTKNEILDKLKSNKHNNFKMQNIYNLIVDNLKEDEINTYIKFEVLQSLRQCYYPSNILPLLMDQLEKSFIKTIKEDLNIKGNTYLLLNK